MDVLRINLGSHACAGRVKRSVIAERTFKSRLWLALT